MELFKLLGTVAIDSSGAIDAINETTETAEKSESRISKAFEKIGSAAINVGKTVAAGLGVASAAVGALTKSALEGYADYEQLVGGVETLFGAGGQSLEEYAESVGKSVDEVKDEYNSMIKAQKKVLKNADKAYQTAGMSANDYMETVTSFSASLIQSLGGDTEAAAEKADQAIVDMSDNANKMGSSMESIQNAYQGFAKQNYTMLDNLKLGYGGTAGEMYRLMQDAAKLDKKFAETAEFSLDATGHLEANYADIVDAIHIVQTEMGITGTTAKEAGLTISGSVDSAKAAWHNLIAGLGKDNADLADLTNQFVNGAITAAENIIPRFVVIKDNIAKVAEDLGGKLFDHISIGILNTEVRFEEVSTKIKTVISNVKENAVSILQNGLAWIQTTAIPTISTVWQSIKSGFEIVKPVIEEAVGKIGELTGKVIEIATEIFGIFSSKFGEVEGTFTAFAEDVLKPLYEKYLNNLIAKFEALVEIWETILLPIIQIVVDAFFEIMSSIYENVQPAIETIMGKFDELATLIRQAVTEYIIPVVQAFVSIIKELYEENKEKLDLIGELFGTISAGIADAVSTLVTWFKEKFLPFLEEIKNFVTENLDEIKATFQKAIDFVTGIIQIFIAFFKGDWAGMWEAVKSTLESAFLFIRGIFELIGAAISEKVLAIKESVTTKFEEIKTSITDKIQAAKDKAMEIFDSISSGISEKINAAKDAVSGAIEKIKGFFNFDVSLPDIKLPHFSISPSGWQLGDLLEGSIPSLGIDWYAKGGVMESPTVFGINGNRVMAGGEAGPEAIAPIDVLQGYVSEAVAGQNAPLIAVLYKILEAILSMDENMGGNLREALEGIGFEVNHREFARLVKAVN